MKQFYLTSGYLSKIVAMLLAILFQSNAPQSLIVLLAFLFLMAANEIFFFWLSRRMRGPQAGLGHHERSRSVRSFVKVFAGAVVIVAYFSWHPIIDSGIVYFEITLLSWVVMLINVSGKVRS